MKQTRLALFAILIAIGTTSARAGDVSITKVEGENKIDIKVADRAFTSYVWGGTKLKEKPLFYPVLSVLGTEVNRSHPLGKRIKGENLDHPHHQSMFFTYADVNGVDYWNRQFKTERMIKPIDYEIDGDKLMLTHHWIDPDGVHVLTEKRVVTFGGGEDVQWMDHDITLTAEAPVTIGDSKEGAFAIRVAHTLREQNGKGHYINAEGLERAGKVWGKQSPWVALSGPVYGEYGEEPVTIAIYSHPETVNQPPYWHARDYGLFAANPFGRRQYDPKFSEPREMKLEKGDEVKVHMKMAIYRGEMDKERLDKDYADYIAE